MIIQAKRPSSPLLQRAVFYAALFVGVAAAHILMLNGLQARGWSPASALAASGGAVLGFIFVLVNVSEWWRDWRAARREARRVALRLPAGPCCVVWFGSHLAAEEAMQWDIVGGPLHVRYPELARRLGIEGVAVVEFEVNAEGRAKTVHCADAWPSDIFYEAARAAVAQARFEPKPDIHVRFGATYQLPFVFRIAGAVRLKQNGAGAR